MQSHTITSAIPLSAKRDFVKKALAYASAFLVGHQGLEPWTDRL